MEPASSRSRPLDGSLARQTTSPHGISLVTFWTSPRARLPRASGGPNLLPRTTCPTLICLRSAKGFTQIEGIDWKEKYASTLPAESMRCFLFDALQNDCAIEEADVVKRLKVPAAALKVIAA